MLESIQNELQASESGLWSRFLALLAGHPAWDLPKPTRRRMALWMLLAVAAVVGFAVHLVVSWASATPVPESPVWETALQARLVAFRLKLAVGMCLGVVGLSWCLFVALDRTPLGKRLLHWSPAMDTDASAAAKTLGAVLVLCSMLLSFAIIAAAVLK